MTRRWTKFAFAAALALGCSGLVSADDHGWRRDRDDPDWRQASPGYDSNRAYQDGIRQGQLDRSNGIRYNYRTPEWRNGDSRWRDSYQQGYQQGYNNAYNRNEYPPARNSPYYGNNYPMSRSSYSNIAFRQGMDDGRMDGRHDATTGHSYRPTEDDNYHHADRGYNHSMGSKDAYKADYRAGYMQGYEQGYGRRR